MTFNLILRARFKLEGQPSLPPPPAPLNPNAVITIEPYERWITSALVGSSSSNTMYLYNPQATPIHMKKVITPGTDFTAKLDTIQDGKRYQLVVATNPALKPGHYVQKIKVETDSSVQPQVVIELDATVYPNVFSSPASIILPAMPIGNELTTATLPPVYVRKVRQQGLKIKSYSSTLPFLKLELITESEGQVYRFKLSMDPAKVSPGAFKGVIHIETNDTDLPAIDIPIQGSFK